MILEPMAGASLERRSREERGKFKEGVARTNGRGVVLGKRSREGDDREAGGKADGVGVQSAPEMKKRKQKGPKGPNPLSMKKPKVREPQETRNAPEERTDASSPAQKKTQNVDVVAPSEGSKKKRKRKHKNKSEAGEGAAAIASTGDMSDG